MASPALPSANSSTPNATPPLSHGWVNQPNGRGTLDIIQSCLTTIFLCSWSVLFLNVPGAESRIGFMRNKAQWMLFTILFPEVITGIAAEQWRSAIQSTEDFRKLGERWKLDLESSPTAEKISQLSENLLRIQSSPWTMRHAFFADMGGLILDCPNIAPFPINSQQLVYLVENDHLMYPSVTERTIWDKNKADGFARVLTLVQIVWFFIQAAGRLIQHLALSTFELSTLAFIFCTMNTYFFWRHKPLDVEVPIVLECTTTIQEILSKAGDRASHRPSIALGTPLDFVRPQISRTDMLAPFWFAVDICFKWKIRSAGTPIKTFGNTKVSPPRGIKFSDIAYGGVFTTMYLGIHLAGWNFHFPSTTERILWRVSSLILIGLLVFYHVMVAVGTVLSGWFAKIFFDNHEAKTILEVASLLPRWVAVLVHGPVIMVYCLARCYIIVEAFVNLRALPLSAFDSVNWSNFVPHA